MIEKIIFLLFGKMIEVVVDIAVHNRQSPEVARMSAYKLLLKEQADNAIARLERDTGAHKSDKRYVCFQLPGHLTESQEKVLMDFVRHYVAGNYNPFAFEDLVFQWQGYDVQVKPKPIRYAKFLKPKTWSSVNYDYQRTKRLPDC
ncbi:hypothetical protein [Vibrio phage BX-1]|nr:hypothetical protein [Vibrio phage BX-1]